MVRLSGKDLCSLFVVLLVFLWTPAVLTSNGLAPNVYQTSDLDALQAIWGAWNTSTPDLERNLAGWSSSQPYPCNQEITAERNPNWRGVQCITNEACARPNATTDGRGECMTLIVIMCLVNASIVGYLPADIGTISTLTVLELVGNPNLTGPLPATLGSTNLFALDLHGNGLSGQIPDLDYRYLNILNLACNRFTGPFPRLPPLNIVSTGLQRLNLSGNSLEGRIPDNAFENMTQLEVLDFSRNRFNGTLPTLNTMKNLRTLDLSSNSFTGVLPNLTSMNSLFAMVLRNNTFTESALESWSPLMHGPSLRELYLDHNLIKGTLNLDYFSSLGLLGVRYPFSNISTLQVLSLMNNSIENVTYNTFSIEYVSTTVRLQGNPYCDSPDMDDGRRCFCNQLCIRSEKNGDQSKAVIISVVTSVSVSLVLLVTVIAAFFYRNRRYRRYLQLQLQQKFEEFEVKPTIFPYNQLRTATHDFHSDMKLGQGAFGAVFKDILPKGNVVAVKQLFAKTSQGVDEFLNEVVLLTGMKHRNLVNLKGCCIREQQRLLVYEYVDNYDVDKLLLQNPTKAHLNWSIRLKICLGVARGLHYLHALAHPRIIHRDIKASNILISKNYDTTIADFGLASLFPDEESYILTRHIAGTKGYLAPEYAAYGQLSDKVDVFSFGVLCLEIISGRRNMNQKLDLDEMYLPNWAWNLHGQGRLLDLVDPTLILQDDEKVVVQNLITISLHCIKLDAKQRPSMERVVALLQGDSESKTLVLELGDTKENLESMGFILDKSDLQAMMEERKSSSLESSSVHSSM